MADYRKLAVATDGSAQASNAVKAAGLLAARLKADVVVVHVLHHEGTWEVPKDLEALERSEHVRVTNHDIVMAAAQEVVDKAAVELRRLGVAKVDTRIEIGDPAGKIMETARRELADVIVMGRRGHGRLGALLMGSVTYKVAQTSDIPCLTVP